MSNSHARLISHRVRRQWFWLGLALAVHVAVLVAVLTLVVRGGVVPIGAAVPAVALVVGSPLVGCWLERRDAVRHRPALWMRRALLVVGPNGCALGLASGAVADGWSVQVLAAAGVMAMQLVCVVLAARALRYPLGPDLGEMPVEVSEKIRSEHQAGIPAWALQDEVRLTGRELVAVLRPGPATAFGIRVRLTDVEGVSVRPAGPDDNPWAQLDGGGRYFVPEGEVVELRHRGGALVVPVRNAAAFAEVIRARIAVIRAMPASS